MNSEARALECLRLMSQMLHNFITNKFQLLKFTDIGHIYLKGQFYQEIIGLE